jgi:hypothetical protein
MKADDCALLMQDTGDFFADAAGCAGNQSLAAGKIEHG